MQHPPLNSPLYAGGRRETASSPELVAGQLVDGKYRLVEPLGRGGMSRVWLAHHEALKTQIAVKFVDERLTLDDETRQLTLERFRFEAQISARLGAKTKHVVAVQDAGSHDGMPYLVMELVAGHTLEKEIDEGGPVDAHRLGTILEQAAGALAVAHEQGIVHRDVKPSNLVVVDTAPGELFVKVGDFGVAKATKNSAAFDHPTETSQGFLVGSPAFMSPEQLRAGGSVDVRTDVWGLGVVAYEALTGKLPFVGVSEADLIVLISTSPFEAVTKTRPELPAEIDAWFEKVLAKEPRDRFQSIADAAAAYRAALDPPVAEGRRRAVWMPLLAAAAFVSVAAIGLLALRRTPPPVHAVAPPPPVEATAAPPKPAPPPPPVAEPTAAPTAEAQAPAPPLTTTPRRAQRATARAAPPPPPPPAATSHPRKEINPSEIQ